MVWPKVQWPEVLCNIIHLIWWWNKPWCSKSTKITFISTSIKKALLRIPKWPGWHLKKFRRTETWCCRRTIFFGLENIEIFSKLKDTLLWGPVTWNKVSFPLEKKIVNRHMWSVDLSVKLHKCGFTLLCYFLMLRKWENNIRIGGEKGFR